MKNLLFKVVSMVIVVTMIASMGMTAFALEYRDDGYWANEAIDAAKATGLLHGKDASGDIDSEANLTRAEMAAVMVRAFGASVKADVSNYVDLDPSAWYYSEFSKAIQMRIFEGDGTGHMYPNDSITREELFTVVARALVLNSSDHSALNKFKDSSKISSWALGYMSVMAEKSYVNGDDLGNIKPKSYITRAEFAQVMYNIFGTNYIPSGSVSDKTYNGSLMIRGEDISLTNIVVNGDLIIGDGANLGKMNLTNVKITGRLVVRGTKTIKLKDTTVGEMVVVNNYSNTVHFDNFRTEKVFNGIILNTKATFKTAGGGGGGGSSGGSSDITVTFYDRDDVKIKSEDVNSEGKIDEAYFPAVDTYNGYFEDATISDIYTTIHASEEIPGKYVHKIKFGWWYKNSIGEWVEFTPDTVVTKDTSVYMRSKKVEAKIFAGNLGKELILNFYYEPETRLADSVKDILNKDKTSIINTLNLSGIVDKVKADKRVQKVLDASDNILNLSAMIRFSQILGEDNIEDFIIDNAKNSLGADVVIDNVDTMISGGKTDDAKSFMRTQLNSALNDDESKLIIQGQINTMMSDSNKFDKIMKDIPAGTYEEMVRGAVEPQINTLSDSSIITIVDLLWPSNSDTFKNMAKDIASTGDLKTLVGDEEYKKLIDSQISTYVGGLTPSELSPIISLIVSKPEYEDEIKGMITGAMIESLGEISPGIAVTESQFNSLPESDSDLVDGNDKASIKQLVINKLKTDSTAIDAIAGNIDKEKIKDIAKEIASDDSGLHSLLGTDYDTIIAKAVDSFVNKLNIETERDKFAPMVVDEILNNPTYKADLIDMVVDIIKTASIDDKDKMFNAICSKTYNKVVTEKLLEILDTPSTDRDTVVEIILDYLINNKTDRDSVIHTFMDQLSDDEKDDLIGEAIDELYKDEFDTLVGQLKNDEKFVITAETKFIAVALKDLIVNKYSYMAFVSPKIPDRLKVAFEIYPESKLQEIYNNAVNALLGQIQDAIDNNGGEIDCGVTPVVNPIEDVYAPLYTGIKNFVEGKVNGTKWNFYYSENKYLQEIIKLLAPNNIFDAGATGAGYSGYALKYADDVEKQIDYYYNLVYKLAVLADDAIVWYSEELDKAELEALTDDYQELVLKYVNIIADILEAYVEDDKVPGKLSAIEQAIKDRYPELISKVVDWYKGSAINKDYAADDYQKIQDVVYKVLSNVGFTTDEFFDKVLSHEKMDIINDKGGKIEASYEKIDENTYKFEVKDYSLTFLRALISYLQ